MRISILVPTLALALLLCGCVVYSTNPLYGEKDLTFDPGLVGVWTDSDKSLSDATWTIRQSGEKQYEIIEGDRKNDEKSAGRLLRLGPHQFLDLQELKDGQPAGRHFFCRIARNGDELTLGIMSPEWLKKKIEEKEIRLPHLPFEPSKEHEVVLTASTKELQALVLKYVNDASAFTTARLRRKAEPRP